MNRPRRSNRSYTRTRRSPLIDRKSAAAGGRGAPAAARLAGLAGGTERALVEPLENRQLLFSLTITDDLVDPLTGVGTIQTYVPYFIPYYATTEEPEEVEPEQTFEDFNDETVPALGVNLQSGFTFAGSNLRIFHNLLVQQVQLNADTVDGAGNDLNIGFAPGGQFSFRLATEEGGTAFRPMQSLALAIGPGGLDTANTRVDLRLAGTVVASFTGSALAALGVPSGNETIFTFPAGGAGAFDEIVFLNIGDTARAFTVDDVDIFTEESAFGGILDEASDFFFSVVFTGPVGATAQFFDLTGAPMFQFRSVGEDPDVPGLIRGDPDGNGIGNWNVGIGRIIISGTNAKSSLILMGGTTERWGEDEDPPEDADFLYFPEREAYFFTDSVLGLYDDFESAGFGYYVDDEGNVAGLPPGPGSVIVGSPIIRTSPEGVATLGSFTSPDQGIRVIGGADMGQIYVHGILHGNSQFSGSVNRIIVGYLPGTIGVAGDLGSLVVGSDAGLAEVDPGFQDDDPDTDIVPIATGGQLVVGRSAGEIVVAGRSLLDVTVRGDLTAPSLRPPREVLRYFEREYAHGIDTDIEDGVKVTLLEILASNQWLAFADFVRGGDTFFTFQQAVIFGNGTFRNDALLSAEFVGSLGTSVEIHGTIGGQDPISTANDAVDVYAFVVDGTRPVEFEVNNVALGLNTRIVDHNGRVVAAANTNDVLNSITGTRTVRFEPGMAGVYYLVISATGLALGNEAINIAYTVTMAGLAPTTLGSYRTGAGFGDPGIGLPNVAVLSGAMGTIRSGTGFFSSSGGGEIDPIVVMNEDEDDVQVRQEFHPVTVTVAGNLYNITAGGDIEGGRIIVGGEFGTLVTGVSPITGIAPEQGDVGIFTLQVGRRIAMLDIKGALGVDQDEDPDALYGLNSVVIRTGTSGAPGDIGMIRIGAHMAGGTLALHTSPNSTIGAFLVSQDIDFDAATTDNIGIYDGPGVFLNLGFNSDVRFFDTPQIDTQQGVDIRLNIVGGQPLEIIDDSGEAVRIEVIGAPAGVLAGTIIVIPVNGSQGVAIARIEVDLTGGRRLQVTGRGQAGSTDILSIGRIVVTGADAASSIGIVGNDEIDVWLIEQTGGTAFSDILNSTPFGDIVAIDVVGLERLEITKGDLGRTQVPSWGPRLIGPFLGIASGAQGTVGGAIGVTPGVMWAGWNGQTFRPIGDVTVNDAALYLEDIGSPVDPYLNGLIVRTGSIQMVTVGGAIGDVITQGGNIIQVIADNDGVTPNGRFDGIVGTIYAVGDGPDAGRITRVEIGDGLAAMAPTPLATTGIFADDDIELVTNTPANPNANIESAIIAGNSVGSGDPLFNGINRVELAGGGDYIGAHIGVTELEDFWIATYVGTGRIMRGTIENLLGEGADFFRSVISANNLTTFRMRDGFFDASYAALRGNADLIEATGFRNSTIGGTDREYRLSAIEAGGNVNILRTINRAGDIVDLVIDVAGSITGEISARHITRTDIDADGRIALLRTLGDIRGSRVAAGELSEVTVDRNIRASVFNIAGPITLIDAKDSIINTSINATGPNGRIIDVRAANTLSGEVRAANAIGRVVTTSGDIVARFETAGGTGTGNVERIQAGRDLIISTDIKGTVQQLIAGRNIGDIGGSTEFILIRGDIVRIDAPNGQIYTDIRVGQNVTERIRIGGVVHKPGNSALGAPTIEVFGRVQRFEVNGDFAGRLISHSGGIRTVRINDGSLLFGSLIAAYDGDLHSVKITRGNLYGDLHADYKLVFLTLEADEDGIFGDIGVNPEFTSGQRFDSRRNNLPPGVAADPTIQGPRITAGTNLGRVEVRGGSVFESFFHAGRAIGTIMVAENITSDPFTGGRTTVIAAGSLINTVQVDGDLNDALIIAGVLDFGADGRPGGSGAAADVLNTGRVFNVNVAGDASNVGVSAGMSAGADGEYNTPDDLVVPGRSLVRHVRVSGDVDDVSIYTDLPVQTAKSGIVRRTTQPNTDPDIAGGSPPGVQLPNGSPFRFTWQGEGGTITFSGPGRAYWDADRGRIVLVNTVNDSSLIVDADDGSLADFDIVTNDDASVGSIIVNADLSGDSDIVIDAFSLNVQVGDFSGTGDIRAGMNIRQLTTGNFTSTGHIKARFIRFLTVNGSFGSAVTPNTIDGESNIELQTGRLITINGQMSGIVSVERTVQFAASTVYRGNIRAGDRLVSFDAGTVRESHISANNGIDVIRVSGNVIDTSFMAGADLGADAVVGGEEADVVTTGHIGNVTIGGNFIESDIVAGIHRGVDGFFGTSDDSLAAGRSSIGTVTIGGAQVGSNVNSEQYRISSTGTIGAVSIGGSAGANQGNFRIERIAAQPAPIRVQSVVVRPEAGVYVARISFNQSIDSSTVAPALRISEVRDSGLTLLTLQEGVDYSVSFDNANGVAVVTFARELTDRNLEADGALGELPGPGVYRFELDADVLRAAVADARLDGNADGAATAGDDFSQDRIVGDAGDRITPGRVTGSEGNIIDFYGPADLDLVMDDNRSADGLPDANVPITVTGAIGDHPDNNTMDFLFAEDRDLYKITLQAGQILRLGQIEGTAALASRVLLNDQGEVQTGVTGDTVTLAVNLQELFELSSEESYLIKRTGVYYISVTGGGGIGDYEFTVNVFDDGDSGFAGGTDASDGTSLVNAPSPAAFAGNDGQLGTNDDLDSIQLGDFIFTLGDDNVVTGTNGDGITSVRRANGTRIITIDSSIGDPGHRGVPADNISPDVDIYHLNNGQLIGAGVRMRVTVRLTDIGADLGSRRQGPLQNGIYTTSSDYSGMVQLALFDTFNATGTGDADLVFAPTDFKPTGGTPGVIATDGQTEYGYDSNGDFYIEFLTPGRFNASGARVASTYAVYLQGAFNTDYQLEVRQFQGNTNPVRYTQNVLIEANGGLVEWLEAGGLSTELDAFDAASLGLTGTIGSQPVRQYLLNRVVQTLQAAFDAAGLSVRISLNPADFEFQDYSTVFISSSFDPVNSITDRLYGVSEHSDALNADHEDEAVVFVPSFGTIGVDPSTAGVNAFADSLSAAVGRRVGELLGLRTTASDFTLNEVDIMSFSSVELPGASFGFLDVSRPLGSPFDGPDSSFFNLPFFGGTGSYDDNDNTDFFLGQQNAVSLLDRILRD